MPNLFPTTPEQTILSKLTNFPESIYTLNPTDHLYKFMLMALGPAGAGQLAQVQDTARNTQNLDNVIYSDLDNVFGQLFYIPRQLSEVYSESVNPFVDQLRQMEWDDVNTKDTNYRERIKYVLQALQKGGTPLGMKLLAEALTGYQFGLVESWRTPGYNLLSFDDSSAVFSLGNYTVTNGTLARASTPYLNYGSSLSVLAVGGSPTVFLTNGGNKYPAIGNQLYSFMAYVAYTGSGVSSPTLEVRWYNAAGTNLSNNTVTLGGSYSSTFQQLLIQDISAPSTATSFTINIAYSGGAGITHYITNVGAFYGSTATWTPGKFGNFTGVANEFTLIPYLPPGVSTLPSSSTSSLSVGLLPMVKPVNTSFAIGKAIQQFNAVSARSACADSEWFTIARHVDPGSATISQSNLNSSSRYWVEPNNTALAPTFSNLLFQQSNINLNNNISTINVSIYSGNVSNTVNNNSVPVNSIIWGPWVSFGTADSPDNYPNGKYPDDASKYNNSTNPPVYIFSWSSQATYLTSMSAWVIAQGGQINGNLYRLPQLNNYSPANNSQNTDMLAPSSVDIYSTVFGAL